MAKTIDVGVVNVFQAAGADAVILKGEVSLSATTATNNPGVGSIGGVEYASLTSYSKTAYAAGTASVKDIEYNGVALTAGVQNTVTITHNGVTNTFSVISATAWADAEAVVDALVEKINQAGSNVQYTAAKITTDNLQITLAAAGVANGDFELSSNTGGAINESTAYEAPSGSEDEVNKASVGSAVSGGQYTKYSLVWDKLVSHNAISGLKAYRTVETLIYAEEGGTNFADFEKYMDAYLAGSSGANGTPVGSVYAFNSASTATLSAGIEKYLGK